MSRVTTGLDILCAEDFARLKGKSIAILANQAAVNSELEHILTLVQNSSSTNLQRLFAPEHGFAGTKQDMEVVEGESHNAVETISLYGSSEAALYPTESNLSDIEVLLVDLPDVGSRYYTFAQTMAYCMQVCAKTKTKVLVLDRPNPINGLSVEGSYLDDDCRSFCGYGSIPQRHGLTLGELATVFNNGLEIQGRSIDAINCDLEVIRMDGWNRQMYFDDTKLPWVLPSVNMPTLDTAIVYPGMCLFEATKLSEGRGTTKPFELIGAPYIDGQQWIQSLKEVYPSLSGAKLRPVQFIPKFQKCADTTCGGVQIHLSDRDLFEPLRWAIALIMAAYRLYPEDFSWRTDAYEFIGHKPAIDLLYGSSNFRKCLERNGNIKEIEDEISSCSNEFLELRKPFLLY